MTPNPFDIVAKRLTVWAGAILTVAALIAATVRWAQNDVRAAIVDARNEVLATRALVYRQAYNDSVRFERVLDVVELAVVALVEPEGSEEQRGAVTELRKRRRVSH